MARETIEESRVKSIEELVKWNLERARQHLRIALQMASDENMDILDKFERYDLAETLMNVDDLLREEFY